MPAPLSSENPRSRPLLPWLQKPAPSLCYGDLHRARLPVGWTGSHSVGVDPHGDLVESYDEFKERRRCERAGLPYKPPQRGRPPNAKEKAETNERRKATWTAKRRAEHRRKYGPIGRAAAKATAKPPAAKRRIADAPRGGKRHVSKMPLRLDTGTGRRRVNSIKRNRGAGFRKKNKQSSAATRKRVRARATIH